MFSSAHNQTRETQKRRQVFGFERQGTRKEEQNVIPAKRHTLRDSKATAVEVTRASKHRTSQDNKRTLALITATQQKTNRTHLSRVSSFEIELKRVGVVALTLLQLAYNTRKHGEESSTRMCSRDTTPRRELKVVSLVWNVNYDTKTQRRRVQQISRPTQSRGSRKATTQNTKHNSKHKADRQWTLVW